MLEQGKVFQLKTPLVTGLDGKEIKRFYSIDEYKKFKKPLKNIRYLKGLGSLSIDDWEHVFKEMFLDVFVIDKNSKSIMDMAFGDNSKSKKEWLIS
jgi:DNA topoisomerase-2